MELCFFPGLFVVRADRIRRRVLDVTVVQRLHWDQMTADQQWPYPYLTQYVEGPPTPPRMLRSVADDAEQFTRADRAYRLVFDAAELRATDASGVQCRVEAAAQRSRDR